MGRKRSRLLPRFPRLATPLRAKHLKHFEGVVGEADELVQELEAGLPELVEARECTQASATNAQHQVHAFFDQLAVHKNDLAQRVQATRKFVWHRLTSATCAHRALVRTLRAAQASALATGSPPSPLAPLPTLRPGEARCVLEFRRGGEVGDLDEWRRRCEVQVVNGGVWTPHLDVRSREMPALRVARSWCASAVAANHSVHVLGGLSPSGELSSCEVLRDGAVAWDAFTDAPVARWQCGACAVGGEIVVVGGRDARRNSVNVVGAVDVVSGTWRALPSLPSRVFGCGVVSCDGWVVVVGGVGGGVRLRTVWGLPLAVDTSGRGGGGRGGSGQEEPSKQWVQLPSLGAARGFLGAAAGGGLVFACGGNNGAARLSSCEMLDMVCVVDGQQGGLAWEPLPSLPTPLFGPGCCFGGGNVFVAGGNGETYLSTLFALSLAQMAWVRVGEMLVPRAACAAVCVDRRVIVVGGFDGTKILSDCEVFDL